MTDTNEFNAANNASYLGLRYELGLGIGKDLKKAVEQYRLAANHGHSAAMFRLGFICEGHGGGERNPVQAFNYYRQAAEKGNIDGMIFLGDCYYFGKGVERNYEEAAEYYRQAEKAGSSYAMYKLACCYANGEGVKEDGKKAFELYRRAVESWNLFAEFSAKFGVQWDDSKAWDSFQVDDGIKLDLANWFSYLPAKKLCFAKAMGALGGHYLMGDGCVQNVDEGVKWLRRAAKAGESEAMFNLGVCYERGVGVDQNMKEAVEWYRDAAKTGYLKAMIKLGDCYAFGLGVKENWEKAVEWMKRAAELGNADAMNKLGFLLFKRESYKEGFDWYLRAAEAGNLDAMNNVARAYAEGKGVEKDKAEAVKWYHRLVKAGELRAIPNLVAIRKSLYDDEQNSEEDLEEYLEEDDNVKQDRQAAENGDASAMCRLGCRYYYGDGVKLSMKKAVMCWRLAADADNTDAMFELGKHLNYFCRGDEQSLKEAFNLLQRAVALGNADAMTSLGISWFKGEGCEQNVDEAIKCWSLAAAAGDEEAKFWLREVAVNR